MKEGKKRKERREGGRKEVWKEEKKEGEGKVFVISPSINCLETSHYQW